MAFFAEGDFQGQRVAGIGRAFGVAEGDDFGAHSLARDVEDANRAEPCGEVMGEDRAAGVDEEDVVAELEAFDVGIAADEDVDRFAVERGIDDLADWAGFGAELVGHAETPPFDVEELAFCHAGVVEEVVVAFGDQDIAELRAPVEDGGGSDVAGVEDEVNAAEGIGDLRAELVQAADERGQVGVRD